MRLSNTMEWDVRNFGVREEPTQLTKDCRMRRSVRHLARDEVLAIKYQPKQ